MVSTQLIKEKDIWENFLLKTEIRPTGGSFLQSWEWALFQEKTGKTTHRIGIFDQNKLVGVSLLILQKAKTTSFLYVPAGPVFSQWKEEYFAKWLSFATDLARENDMVFLRIEPRVLPENAKQIIKESGFLIASEYTQPECTAVLDLSPSENDLLGKMSSSTRYNIGMSIRKGVVIRNGEREEISVFLNFLKKTARKKGLVLPVEKNYHKNQFETLGKKGVMELFIAEHEGKPLASALVLFHQDTGYYLHAANSFEKRNLRASYPLVWRSILEAKKRNLKWFDFWGIAESDNPKDSWAGITSFKLSFGAKRVCFQPPFDFPLKGSYKVSRLVESWRRPLRKIARFR